MRVRCGQMGEFSFVYTSLDGGSLSGRRYDVEYGGLDYIRG